MSVTVVVTVTPTGGKPFDTEALREGLAHLIADFYGTNGPELHGFDETSATADQIFIDGRRYDPTTQVLAERPVAGSSEARPRVLDWLGRGAPADELDVIMRRALREIVNVPEQPEDNTLGLLRGSVPVPKGLKLAWPRDPVPGSEDDFRDVGIDYELTVHVRTGDDTDDMMTVTFRAQSLYDPRLPAREQLAEDIADLVGQAARVAGADAVHRAYMGRVPAEIASAS